MQLLWKRESDFIIAVYIIRDRRHTKHEIDRLCSSSRHVDTHILSKVESKMALVQAGTCIADQVTSRATNRLPTFRTVVDLENGSERGTSKCTATEYLFPATSYVLKRITKRVNKRKILNVLY